MVAITGHQITFQFQLGLVRDRVTVDSNELNLNSLKVRTKTITLKSKTVRFIINLPHFILILLNISMLLFYLKPHNLMPLVTMPMEF